MLQWLLSAICLWFYRSAHDKEHALLNQRDGPNYNPKWANDQNTGFPILLQHAKVFSPTSRYCVRPRTVPPLQA